jgi:hypothetical protein
MRRLLVAGLFGLLLVLPATSQADLVPLPAHDPGHNDGCLVVSNGNGIVSISARGGIFGRFDQGQITIEDLSPADSQIPKVFGAQDVVTLSKTKTRYRGDSVRFRFTGGGAFRVTVTGIGIDLSAIGHGWAVLNGGGYVQTGGTYSADAGSLCSKAGKSFPESQLRVLLGPGTN